MSLLQIRLLPPEEDTRIRLQLRVTCRCRRSDHNNPTPRLPKLRRECRSRIILLWLSFVACQLPVRTSKFRLPRLTASVRNLESRSQSIHQKDQPCALWAGGVASKLIIFFSSLSETQPSFQIPRHSCRCRYGRPGFLPTLKNHITGTKSESHTHRIVCCETAQPLRQDECRRL